MARVFLVRGGKVDMREGEETFAHFNNAGSGADGTGEVVVS